MCILRLKFALTLLDLYFSMELMENIEDGTDNLEDNVDKREEEKEGRSVDVGLVLLTGSKKRKYQSLYTNSAISDCPKM